MVRNSKNVRRERCEHVLRVSNNTIVAFKIPKQMLQDTDMHTVHIVFIGARRDRDHVKDL
jgi:hypothetical protein